MPADDLETRRQLALHGTLPSQPSKDILRGTLSHIYGWHREVAEELEGAAHIRSASRGREQAVLQSRLDQLQERRDHLEGVKQQHYPELPIWVWYDDASEAVNTPLPRNP